MKITWQGWLLIAGLLAFALFLLCGCGSTKLISSNTTTSADTNIVIHQHTIIPPVIRDAVIPHWVNPSPSIINLIGRDSSEIVIDVHNATGKVIGKVRTKPFLSQSTIDIQPDQIGRAHV